MCDMSSALCVHAARRLWMRMSATQCTQCTTLLCCIDASPPVCIAAVGNIMKAHHAHLSTPPALLAPVSVHALGVGHAGVCHARHRCHDVRSATAKATHVASRERRAERARARAAVRAAAGRSRACSWRRSWWRRGERAAAAREGGVAARAHAGGAEGAAACGCEGGPQGGGGRQPGTRRVAAAAVCAAAPGVA
jgi:hypothetical protein